MIEGVALHPLRQFVDDRGRTMHMLRSDDSHFRAFGEIYFSGVRHGKIKGWYRHREKTLNYAVPAGMIRVVIYDDRPASPTLRSNRSRYQLVEDGLETSRKQWSDSTVFSIEPHAVADIKPMERFA